jgi:hypothetical protein
MTEIGIKPTGLAHLYEVNYPAQGQYGYLVKLCRHRKKVYRLFNFNRFATPEECRRAAETYARQVEQDYPRLSRRARSELRRSHFKGEVIGVRRLIRKVKGREYAFWLATWSPQPGVIAKRIFSVRKYGETGAQAKARAARAAGLASLEDDWGRPAVTLDVTLL